MKLQFKQRLLLPLFIVFAAAVCGRATAGPNDGAPDHVTVPLIVEGNRPYIDLTFRRPDGSTRSARFLVDSGGGGFIITEPVARDLGLRWDKTMREEGREFAQPTESPKAFVGEMPLDLDPQRVIVAVGTDRLLPPSVGGRSEGMFPGHLLARYHVVFD
ncbi:MAG TPA: hypothetical protein VG477_05555, partial [Thermoanaerobaculia bacterium]|nr:hypothetical protein [Thermoanaerobaculia bacterium]